MDYLLNMELDRHWRGKSYLTNPSDRVTLQLKKVVESPPGNYSWVDHTEQERIYYPEGSMPPLQATVLPGGVVRVGPVPTAPTPPPLQGTQSQRVVSVLVQCDEPDIDLGFGSNIVPLGDLRGDGSLAVAVSAAGQVATVPRESVSFGTTRRQVHGAVHVLHVRSVEKAEVVYGGQLHGLHEQVQRAVD